MPKGSNGVAVSLAQSSYDAAGRLDCTTTRMNPSIYGSLPSSACTAGTAGSHGPDRIVKVNYNAADEVTSVVSAYGTAAQATDVTRTYTTNGKLASVTDAESNRTTYEYDGFDRLAKVRYPVTTKGANASSTTDYEQFTYDASGNVLTRRKRDGQTAAFTYDALNRPTLKNLPGSELDVTYSFDLRGRMTGASQTGNALTFGYDALDRLTSAGGPLGTVSYQYDAAGRRTRTTWPDSFYVSYDYRVTGEVSKIRENGAASGLGVLATYGYDAQGRRVSLTRGNGTVTTYGVDTASRLSSLALNLDGATTTNDVTTTFAYSPANQITSQTRTNDGYAWTGHANLARGYTSNGLNQLTVSGNRTLSYDARGNLWKDQLTGTPTSGTEYVFDSENKLGTVRTTAASPVTLATLAYDPLLRLYQTATPTPTTARFQYDGTDLIAEYNGSNVLQKRYVHGPGTDEPLVEYAGSGTGSGVRTFLHADERGSIVARSNEAGAKTAIISYDEYGIPANGAGRFLYTGQTWLPEVGIYYYKARVYSPTLGRFLQTDPIGYGDGMNWYNYAHSDPVNGTDPSGLDYTDSLGNIYRYRCAGEGDTLTCGWGSAGFAGWNLNELTCDGGAVAQCRTWADWWGLAFGQAGGGGGGGDEPAATQGESTRCPSQIMQVLSYSYGGTAFAGVGTDLGIGANAGVEIGVTRPLAKPGSIQGSQLFFSVNFTPLITGIGAFIGVGGGGQTGYSLDPIKWGPDSNHELRVGGAYRAGGEVAVNIDGGRSGSVSISRDTGFGAYLAGGKKFSYTLATPQIGCNWNY